MIRQFAAVSLAALVCACGQAGSPAAPPSAPAAASTSGTPAVASVAAPADASGAEAFLRQALHAYDPPAPAPTRAQLNAVPPTVRDTGTRAQQADAEARENATLYTPQLVDLMRRDRLSTNDGEVGVLDYNPLCMCQDDGGLRLGTIATAPGPNGQVVATTTFTMATTPPRPMTLRYVLERTPAGWRIANVIDPNAGDGIAVDTLALLTNGVAEQERAAHAPASGSASAAGPARR